LPEIKEHHGVKKVLAIHARIKRSKREFAIQHGWHAVVAHPGGAKQQYLRVAGECVVDQAARLARTRLSVEPAEAGAEPEAAAEEEVEIEIDGRIRR